MQDAGFKECPFCKEKIRKEAVKCRFCGEWLEQPVFPASSQPAIQESAKIPSPATIETIEPAPVVKNRTGTKPASSINATQNQDAAPPETSEVTPLPIKKNEETRWPIIPLVLILFWIFWFVFPKAIEIGISNKKYLFLNSLIYCATSITIIVLFLLLYWFTKSYQSYRSSRKAVDVNKGRSANLLYVLSLGVGIIVLGSIAFIKSYSAWEQRVAKDTQDMQAKGINLDALKGWEINNNNQNIGDAKTGLSPEIKKRMREQFALECRGELASIEGVSVELQGENQAKRT
jgi:hypothetical protein